MIIDKNAIIYIAGHKGMVGSATWKKLKEKGYKNLIGKSSSELDLRNQQEVDEFFKNNKPEIIIDAAAKVGGIMFNQRNPFEFLIDNMQIQNNLISCSLNYNVRKFIFLGSSCIYPKYSTQPIKEEFLLDGKLEPTNEAYAIAKISGLKLCEYARKQFNRDFISLMPTNLYGPNDNFDIEKSHVIPAMIVKFHNANQKHINEVKLWGSGNPYREFLHVEDLANAVLFCIENKIPDNLYNVGYGSDITIRELAHKIKKITGFKGDVIWDIEKPDGTPRKLVDSSKIEKLGWKPLIDLEEGLIETYNWYKNSLIDL